MSILNKLELKEIRQNSNIKSLSMRNVLTNAIEILDIVEIIKSLDCFELSNRFYDVNVCKPEYRIRFSSCSDGIKLFIDNRLFIELNKSEFDELHEAIMDIAENKDV